MKIFRKKFLKFFKWAIKTMEPYITQEELNEYIKKYEEMKRYDEMVEQHERQVKND